MFREKETKKEEMKTENKKVESSAQKPMPSIWYC